MTERAEQAWVTILKPANQGDLAVAKSILEGSEIPHFVRGEATNQMWGVQLIAEGVEIQVPSDFVDDARAVLEPLSRVD